MYVFWNVMAYVLQYYVISSVFAENTPMHLTYLHPDILANMKNRFGEGKQVWGKIGEDIELSCSAHGQPTPVLSWIKNGVTLNTDSSTLKISSATMEDSGIYECWANNTHGEEYMPFYVNITSRLPNYR